VRNAIGMTAPQADPTKNIHVTAVLTDETTLDEVELVWTEQPEGVIDPRGLLKLQLKDRPGTLAAIRLKRGEAEQVRTILEARGSYLH
jgi:hypothetical protein